MPINKILAVASDDLLLEEFNVDTICTYYFSLAWSTPGICNLYLLQGSIGDGPPHNIITHWISDHDGEITVKIGEFRKGAVINLRFGVQAVTPIERIVAIVTNATEKVGVKIAPAGDPKKLDKGQPWNELIRNYALH